MRSAKFLLTEENFVSIAWCGCILGAKRYNIWFTQGSSAWQLSFVHWRAILSEYLYEGMFLLDSNRFAADPEGTTNGIIGILERCGATLVAHRPWQENKLTYPIKGHRKGLYYLACFKMEGTKVDELTRLGKLNDSILRQMVIHHPKVVFDAMVDALSGDGTIHSPEQRADNGIPREDGPRGEKPTDFE